MLRIKADRMCELNKYGYRFTGSYNRGDRWTTEIADCIGDGILIQGERVEGCYVYGNNLNHHIRAFNNRYSISGLYTVIPETVGQYTGLNDKNGRKIFENDVMALDGWASAHSYEYPGEGDECTVQAEIM